MEKLFKKGNITQLIFNFITLSKFGNEFIKIILSLTMFEGVKMIFKISIKYIEI